jgi:NAD(P)-dependent dehydrogenase (short-subunit alcohol dehydrogenase family)
MIHTGGMVQDKVVIVTGAGRGIGQAIAKMMAAHGAKVVVNDIGTSVHGEGADQAPAQDTVDQIKAMGGQAVASTESVARWEGAQRIAEMAMDTFGRIDCVVNNAAVLRDVIFHKMEPEDWEAVVGVGLNGSFYVSRAVAPHFRKQESGSYVHITSTSGLIGGVGQANYGAMKIGLVGLSKGIALDMARYNVRSNVVAPTAFTRMTESIPTTTQEQKDRVFKRPQVPAEKNAPLVVFLASDAANDVTGQVFYSRNNELILFSQMRPARTIHMSEGWTPEAVAEHMLPALKPSFYPLDRTRDVFKSWLP